MPLHVQQELGGGPAALCLYPLQGRSPSHVQACPGVPKTMRRELAIGSKGFLDQWSPDACAEGAGVDVATSGVLEEQPVAREIGRCSRSKNLHDARGQFYHPLASGLGWTEIDPARQAASDACDALVKV